VDLSDVTMDLMTKLWIAERVTPGTDRFARLIRAIPDPNEIYRADAECLEKIFSKHCRDIKRLLDKSMDDVERIVEFCALRNIRILTYWDDAYPAKLREIADPPAWLFLLGTLPSLEKEFAVGIVGTRDPSDYGLRMSFEIASDLATAGAVTVSGMALGIDGTVAAATLDAKGKTVAVLGCGIDIIYPSCHAALFHSIIKNGAIVTEYPPGTPPDRPNFPKRNRLISALSDAVIVTEGSLRSGSLITASHATAQGRGVYALPGQVDSPLGEGTMKLLRNGARPIACAEDLLSDFESTYPDRINPFKLINKSPASMEPVLKRYGVQTKSSLKRKPRRGATHEVPIAPQQKPPVATEDREKSLKGDLLTVYRRIPEEGECIPDHLVGGALDICAVSAALTVLEIRGLIRTLPGGRIRRAK
jgi:DNA processing protein